MRPFQATSHALLLDRPRRLLASAVGAATHEGAGKDQRRAPVAPRPAERAAVGGAGAGAPPERLRSATAEAPLRVHLAGDSFLADVARGLGGSVSARSTWRVTTDAKVGTGLSRPDVLDWPARLAARVPADAEVVVLGFGGNDAQDLLVEGKQARLASPAWVAEYRKRVAEAVAVVARPGRTVVWVGLPVSRARNIERARPDMTSAAREVLAEHPGSLFLDAATVLSGGTQRYSDLLRVGSEVVRVRAADGFHLAPAGATLLARSLVELVTAGETSSEEGEEATATTGSSTTSSTTSAVPSTTATSRRSVTTTTTRRRATATTRLGATTTTGRRSTTTR